MMSGTLEQLGGISRWVYSNWELVYTYPYIQVGFVAFNKISQYKYYGVNTKHNNSFNYFHIL